MTPSPLDTGPREMPALHASDERAALTGMLEQYREGVVRKVEAMAQSATTSSPATSGTTAAGLVKHLARVEGAWVTRRLAGRGEPEPWASAPFDRDPDWDFHSANGEALSEVVGLYRAVCQRSRAVIAALDVDHTAVDERGWEISLRSVLVHLVGETARHLGHPDVLRELADGRTGEQHQELVGDVMFRAAATPRRWWSSLVLARTRSVGRSVPPGVAVLGGPARSAGQAPPGVQGAVAHRQPDHEGEQQYPHGVDGQDHQQPEAQHGLSTTLFMASERSGALVGPSWPCRAARGRRDGVAW